MQDEDPTVPDEVGAEHDAVQVVGVGALLVEHHLLQLLPILPWSGLQSDFWEENSDHDDPLHVVIKLVVDDNCEEQGDGDDEMITDQGDDDEGNTNDPLHVVVEGVCLVPAVAPVWVVAHLSF